MASKRKNYEAAYEDKKAGMTYQEIAAKYKVSLSAVQAWQKRYWREWDNVHQESENVQIDEECTEDVHKDVQSNGQATLAKPDRTSVAGIVENAASRQMEMIRSGELWDYNADNLPEIELRQARFVREYLIDLNQRQAAIRAGYPIGGADSAASRLLANEKVHAHISAAMAERSRRTGINADVTLRELARIARANPARVLLEDGSINTEASEDDLAAIQAVKVKCLGWSKDTGEPLYEREVRFYDKNKSLELLMKHQGLLIERKQVDVVQRIDEMTDDQRRKRIEELKNQLAIDVEGVRVE